MSDPLLESLKLQEPLQTVKACVLTHLLKIASEALIFIDLNGKVLVASETACQKLKMKEGYRYWDLLPDDYFGFSMRESLLFGISHRLIYKRLNELDWEISSSFIYDGPKTAWGLVLNLKDVTQAQKAAQDLHRSDRLRQLGQIAATVAHEIQNPLGGIRGYATLLYRDLANEPHLQEMAGFVIEGTRTLEKQVQAILHYARPVQLELQSVELGAYLKRLIRTVRVDPACPEAVRWEFHIPNGPIWAPIDPDALQRALLNLIFNAFQAMPQGGTLTISLLRMESSCQISISDTGVGMGEELQKNLFSPFFTTKQQGNGIGLVETQKIVQAHSGTINIRSQPNKGTTVTLTLPVKR